MTKRHIQEKKGKKKKEKQRPKEKTQQKKIITNRRETIEDSLRIYTWKEKGIEACLLHMYRETGRHHDDDDGSN
jgi:hypothetical protein